MPRVLACFAAAVQHAGDVVVFLLGRRHAGALADAAEDDAGQRQRAHVGRLVDRDFQMLDRRVRAHRGPGALRQAERADGRQIVLLEQLAAVLGIDGRRVQQRDLDEIHPVA